MSLEIKIQKCPHKWNEIENKSTQNFCKYCKINVPDLSKKSFSQLEEEVPKYSCARFHERHIETNRSRYFFINRFESKLESWGIVKITSVFVLLYLFIVGCGTKHKLTGAYADFSVKNKSNQVWIESENQKEELSNLD